MDLFMQKTNNKNNNNIRDLFEMATFGFDAGLEMLQEVVDNTGQLFQCDFVPAHALASRMLQME